MIVKQILGQREYRAYVLKGEDYKEGHPTFHPMCIYERDRDHLVIEFTSATDRIEHSIMSPSMANKFLYIIIEATDDEKKRLRDSGYQMIGLV
jgi:hypothetical protein